MSLRDRVIDELSRKAWELGLGYGTDHRFIDVEARCTPGTSDAMDRAAFRLGSPSKYFDVFKYGAQSVWRERGEIK